MVCRMVGISPLRAQEMHYWTPARSAWILHQAERGPWSGLYWTPTPSWMSCALPLRETPLLADVDLLSARELELGPTEGLDNVILVLVSGADGDQDLSDLDAGHGSVCLTEGSSHSSLQPIGASARQHFVDTQNVEGVHTNTDMELVLSGGLDEVLVAADPSGLHGLGGQLLQFVGHQMDGEGELINSGPLTSEIEDTDLGIGHTPVESRLGVGLVLAITVASRGPTTHFGSLVEVNQAILAW